MIADKFQMVSNSGYVAPEARWKPHLAHLWLPLLLLRLTCAVATATDTFSAPSFTALPTALPSAEG